MTIQKLSGYQSVLIVSLFLTSHLCSARNGQNLRRYLYNVVTGAPHPDHCNNDCVHGSCVGHKTQQGYIDYYHCECDYGWYGYHCIHQHGAPGTQHLDPCHNDCVHGSCVGHTNHHGHIDYYHCACYHGWYGEHCTYLHGAVQPDSSRSTSTGSTTTTSSTTITTTTTNAPKLTTLMTPLPTSSKILATSIKTSTAILHCDHSAVITAIAQQTPVVNQNAQECSPGSHTSHDALVLTNCGVPQSPSSWQPGLNVMSYCGGTASLPAYTPIAAFDNGSYSPKGSMSGIFLRCTSTGFKIVVQSCGQSPRITEIALGGTNTQNPNTYYTIS